MRVTSVRACVSVSVSVCVRARVFQEEPIVLNRKKKLGSHRVRDFNADFEFGERDGPDEACAWLMPDVLKQLKNKVEPVAVVLGDICGVCGGSEMFPGGTFFWSDKN